MIDWGKIVGAAVGAGLIALQVGMDSRLKTHETTTQRDVDRIESNAVHSATIEAANKILNERILRLEREMNSMYTGMDGD